VSAVDLLATLTPEKRLLLEVLRREKRGGKGPAAAVSPPPAARSRPRVEPFGMLSAADRQLLPAGLEDAYPLTTVQLGMLYHMELASDETTPAYHNVNSFHLRCPFDLETFQRAVQRVVDRHPILRTSFDLTTYSEPLQLVHRTAAMPIAVTDLRALATFEEQRPLLRRFFDEENRHFVPLDRPPLMRFHLHRRTDETLQFTLTEPHAISDGWSTTSTLAEIFELYLALLRGGPEPAEPPAATSFRDYVFLERQAIASPEHREYWARKLAGSSTLSLPRWPGEERRRAGYHRKPTVQVPNEVLDGLMRLARASEVPLKSVLLAVHLKALSIFTGQADLLTGLITHGRPEELDGERIRGLFVNTVPFRLRLPAGSWAELVRATFANEVELLPHRRYPLIALQRAEQPLIDAAFTYLHFHSVERVLRSGEITFLDRGHSDRSVDHYPLSATFVYDQSEEPVLTLTLEHGAELCPEQIEVLLALYSRVAAAVAADPEARHDGVCLLAAAERQQVQVEWSRGKQALRGREPLHALFAAQAAATPEVVAVGADGISLSYRELDRRANRVAWFLGRCGVRSETRVALCVERGLEMVIGILGILKAGGAYVPLDPEYPQERLTFMAEDARAPVVLTVSRLRERFGGTARVVCLDGDAAVIAAERGDDPGVEVPPDGLAYVIYTSGSTGRPKGVMISHRAIANRLLWMQETFPLGADDRVLQKTPFSFDASVWEIFAPLLGGARLQLARPGGHRDSAYLTESVRMQGITILQLVPSMLQVVVEDPGFASCRSLRRLFCGGEALGSDVAARALDRLDVELCNLYGPTEAAIDVAFRPCRREATAGTVPLGRPLSNLWILVLAPDGAPVPPGTPGELFVGGVNLARGYLGRPDLTVERFVPDRWSGESGARLYRTGDLVRWSLRGELEFLGRIDQQVKIRGFRVEPAEIEAVLASHPQVWQAAVVARERAGAHELAAYLVANEAPPAVSALRGFLAERLPEHMIPAAFVFLGELPRTPSGKLDRRALPAGSPGAGAGETAYAAPRTPVEELLARLWADVLGVERVGIHTGFFELGGHSLAVTRVVSRARHAFGIELRMARLFEAPTIAGFAKVVEAALHAGEKTHVPPLAPAPRDRPLPLSFAQQRLWFLQQLEPASTAYSIPIFLRVRGTLDLRCLRRAMSEVVRRHESLRTCFPVVDGQPVQRIAPARLQEVPQVDLRALPAAVREAEAKRLADGEAARPFDLACGPVVRTSLLRLASQEQVVLFTLHHITSDGWSTGLLVREVGALYQAFTAREPSPLPELPLQYADFAWWQRQWLQGEVLETQLAFWRQRLAGSAAGGELPADRPRPVGRSHRAGYRAWSLPEELTGRLEALCRRHEVTLFMALVAGFDVLLSHCSGRTDVVIGTDVANRNHVGTEGLIGFFVNQLVLRTDLSGNPGVADLLRRVREVALTAYAHQDLPFERLVEELEPERDTARTPLFQTKLVLQNAPAANLELPGLSLAGQASESGIAKFDFLLNLAVTAAGLNGAVEYSADLFDAATVDRLLAQYTLVLERLVAEGEQRLDDLFEALREDDFRRQEQGKREREQGHRERMKVARRKVLAPAVEEREA
jgi:amino acid adenylation domain-containing protein